VLLRLITERGRPSVKISASEEAAGATLVGPSDTHNTYTILQAKRTASSLKLKDEDGAETLVSATRQPAIATGVNGGIRASTASP
jgi:hypothetical protein